MSRSSPQKPSSPSIPAQALRYKRHENVTETKGAGAWRLQSGCCILKAVLSEDGQRTYLKSYGADEQGRRFEITLEGDVVSQLQDDNFIFASGDEPFSELQLLGVPAPEQFG